MSLTLAVDYRLVKKGEREKGDMLLLYVQGFSFVPPSISPFAENDEKVGNPEDE